MWHSTVYSRGDGAREDAVHNLKDAAQQRDYTYEVVKSCCLEQRTPPRLMDNSARADALDCATCGTFLLFGLSLFARPPARPPARPTDRARVRPSRRQDSNPCALL